MPIWPMFADACASFSSPNVPSHWMSTVGALTDWLAWPQRRRRRLHVRKKRPSAGKRWLQPTDVVVWRLFGSAGLAAPPRPSPKRRPRRIVADEGSQGWPLENHCPPADRCTSRPGWPALHRVRTTTDGRKSLHSDSHRRPRQTASPDPARPFSANRAAYDLHIEQCAAHRAGRSIPFHH